MKIHLAGRQKKQNSNHNDSLVLAAEIQNKIEIYVQDNFKFLAASQVNVTVWVRGQ